ncbi:MAG: insulinase family protein [Magnetococcales bacterium]|nr:insulinase family protein [Magnetococcales bacterium]
MNVAWGLESEALTLGNGLRLIMVREPKAPVVVTQVWYRVGGVDEVTGKTGLSHMLEHMMFQGTREVPPGGYGRMIARHGGEENASTTWDFTDYWSKLSSDQLDLALKLESDRMHNLVLDADRFQSENNVVREERRSRFDSNPQGRFFEKFRHFFFQDHPYGRPVIGWMKDIEGYTVADLESWYRRHYTPDNAIVVIVGDVDFAQGKKLVETYFGSIQPSAGKRGERLPKTQPIVGGRRLVERDPGVMAPSLHIAWPAPSYTFGDAADVPALDVLATILGGGGSSRLYRHVVMEQQKAVMVQSQYSGMTLGVDSLDIYADPWDGFPVEDLEKAVVAEVADLREHLVTDEELQRAKNGLLAERIYDRDSVDHLASLIGQLSIIGLDWRHFVEGYPQMIQEVTAERIREVAVRHLGLDKAVVGILTP